MLSNEDYNWDWDVVQPIAPLPQCCAEETTVQLCRAWKTCDPRAPLGLFLPLSWFLLIKSFSSLHFFFFVCFYFASQGHDDAVPCAVLKSVDSFSFLHHPVHQRSLEILQRCKEEKYSKAPPPALPSDTTLTRPEMETRCIPRRKGKKQCLRSPPWPNQVP